jgi:hypothetical protein
VTSIGWGAFYRCTDLTQVAIPDSVTSIGDMTFYCCSSLTHVVIPDSVTEIGVGAFEGCTSLTHVDIPDGVMSIGEGSLRDMPSLKIVSIAGLITFANLKACFNVWVDDKEFREQDPLLGDEVLPQAGFYLIRRVLKIDLSQKIARSGNIYAKRFCYLLLLIKNSIAMSLPEMPTEMWLSIADFYYQEYFPKLDIITTRRGLEELAPLYSDHKEALISYKWDMSKLQILEMSCGLLRG